MVDERIRDDAGRDSIAGPGARLHEARERAGLSQQDLADRLHLSVSIVEHLEADRFDALPEPAYVRGYLRACARALDLDSEPLIAAFDAQGVREPELDTPPAVGGPRVPAARRGHRRGPYVLGAVILAGVGVLIAYGWYERQAVVSTVSINNADRITIEERLRPSRMDAPPALPAEPPVTMPEHESASEPRAEALPDMPPPPVIGDRGMAPEPEIEAPPVVREPVEAAPDPEPAPAPAEAEPQPPVAQAESGTPADEPAPAADALDNLLLTFVDDSWVEIYDANDQRLLVGLMREGTERRLSGVAPFRVFLGNAPGVRLRINEEVYDPSRHARSDNTARFVLESS